MTDPHIDDYEPDPGECPNCGAPTGGGPCGNAGPSGLSCRNLIELGAAATRRDWAAYERLAAQITANYPHAATVLADDLKHAKERANAH